MNDYATDAEVRDGLRMPFDPKLIAKLPKSDRRPALDYVGHAAVTDRLNQEAPGWTMSQPEVIVSSDGHVIAIIASMTIGSVTRWEVGDVDQRSTYGAELKLAFSDWIRRAAMRYGVALDLWSKEDLFSAGASQSAQQDAEAVTAPAAGSDPDPTVAYGEGAPEGNGSDSATMQQWANLLSRNGGHTGAALKELNEIAGTAYPSYRVAKEKATKAELEKVLA